MTKTKFNTRQTYELKKEFMEHPTGKSETIPDDSYTIQELMQKFQAGIPINQRLGNYDDIQDEEEEVRHDDEDLEKFNNLDLAEQEEILAEARKHIMTDRDLKRQKMQEEIQRQEDEKLEKAIALKMREREEQKAKEKGEQKEGGNGA